MTAEKKNELWEFDVAEEITGATSVEVMKKPQKRTNDRPKKLELEVSTKPMKSRKEYAERDDTDHREGRHPLEKLGKSGRSLLLTGSEVGAGFFVRVLASGLDLALSVAVLWGSLPFVVTSAPQLEMLRSYAPLVLSLLDQVRSYGIDLTVVPGLDPFQLVMEMVALALLWLCLVVVPMALVRCSVGKFLLGLRVVHHQSGERLGLLTLILREFLFKPLSCLTVLGALLGMVGVKRMLHDRLSGSLVIR